MRMSRATTSIVMTLACALALPAAAQTGSPASKAAPKSPAMAYALEMGGKSAPLFGVQGLPGPEVILEAGSGLPQPFYEWVRGGLLGKFAPLPATLHGADASGQHGETVVLDKPKLVEVSFPALDAASRAAMRMDVKVQATAQAEPTPKAPGAPRHPNSTRWLAAGYRLTLGRLDTRHVARIAAFTLHPGTAAQIEVTTTGSTTDALAAIAPTPKRRLAAPVGEGTLEFLAADGSVVATLVMQGVFLTDFYYGVPATPSAAKPGVFGVMAQRVDLTFTPAMSR